MFDRSSISPEQSEEVVLGAITDDAPDGYKMVSIHELREMYGMFMNKQNMHMPVAQLFAMITDVVRAINTYKGVVAVKFPLDAWIYQEIIFERKPSVIIEIGNQSGGSTMYLRDLLFNADILDAKGIIGIDIERRKMMQRALNYPDIKWITGDATTYEVFDKVKALLSPDDRVMVIDDGSHQYEDVLTQLYRYGELVSKGQYYIVEDTFLNEFMPFGSNNEMAYAAVHKFMEGNKDFRIDKQREKYFLTFNPDGYLEKIR